MLLRKDCCRHQQRRLLSVLNTFENCAQSHLGFSVSNVAAEQPVHRAYLLHVRLDFFKALFLVGCQFIREAFLKGSLPGGVLGKGKTFCVCPLGI